ncbi:MAG: hypothetical protein LAN18_04410 [Acidobacteriia bacterium]|nr:hypothetical protein [Terriglobia bacterium]
MAKFGLFTAISSVPMQEYDGDYMKQTGEYVTIFKRRPQGTGMVDDQVAAVRLEKGYSVKKISD